MLLSLLTTALLAASGASARYSRPRPSYKDVRSKIDDTNDNTGGDTVHAGTGNGEKTTIIAHVSCESSAWADSYKSQENAYAHAVKSAIKDTCYYGYDWNYWKKSYKFMQDWAHAYVHAYAETEAECTAYTYGTGGQVSGCAYARADADALTWAFAKAHASATAEAFADYCSCENAEAWAFGDADIVVKLIAAAWAEAESYACAEGPYEHSKASAYADCYANVVAKVWAYALAESAADAGCWPGQDAHASAEIVATVGAHIDKSAFCIKNVDEYSTHGGADANTGYSDSLAEHIPITPPQH